jgi:UDP-N-acetylmuramoyl-L-alanyl-D-glutamate--2,6-diaminopimelate ligase
LNGGFNVLNLLAVIALGEAIGLDPTAVRAGLESVAAIPGRMERIDAGQPFEVVVDYAHTPASLTTVLAELGRHAKQRRGELIVVFGSAGERDTQKRPDMGRIAGELCRLVVLTDEDPRGEPEAIPPRSPPAPGRGPSPERPLHRRQGGRHRGGLRPRRARRRVVLAGKPRADDLVDHALPWDERRAAPTPWPRWATGVLTPAEERLARLGPLLDCDDDGQCPQPHRRTRRALEHAASGVVLERGRRGDPGAGARPEHHADPAHR